MIAYKLPCACGNQLTVVAAQAGEMIRCVCGSTLEVPTIRKLAGLEIVADEPPPARHWGNRQRVIFLGLVLTVIGLGAAAALQLSRAKLPYDPLKMTPGQTMRLWAELTEWYDLSHSLARSHPLIAAMADYNQVLDGWTFWAAALAGTGLVVTAAGFALRLLNRSPRRPTPAAAAPRARRPAKKRGR